MQYAIKLILSAALIVIVSEVSKKSALVGSITASLPLVSIIALCWLYYETKNIEQVSSLSSGIFWLVIPSLVLFIALPILLKMGFNFYLSMAGSSAIMVVCYFLMLAILKRFGIEI